MKYKITREAIDYVFGETKAFRDPETAKAICEMRLVGKMYKTIGEKYYLSPEGCNMIVKKVVQLYQERSGNEGN